MTTNRRLAAIMVADVVGYSRMMEADEVGTLAALKQRRKEVLEPVVKAHGGRIVKVMGDGVLVEFGSAVNAVTAAVELQKRMATANEGFDDVGHLELRIGINLGDVIGEGSDIYGDGVNVAARLESVADPGGIAISSKLFDEVKAKVQLNFADKGEMQLKNITQPVHVYQVQVGRAKPPPKSNLTLPEKPSIAILPFINMSGDPEQEYFTDGLTEDIITDISNVPGFFVIARNSTFSYKGKSVDVRQIARELGVKYILEGSARRSGQRIRINAQLIDAAVGGSHIWAERFDRELADIFAVQDEVTHRVVEAIAGKLRTHLIHERYRPSSIEAYELCLRSRDKWADSKVANDEAKANAEKAIALDPNYAEAEAQLANSLIFGWLFWGYPQQPHRRNALIHAQRAVELDPGDSGPRVSLGYILLFERRFDEAKLQYDTAVQLNPNNADAFADLAEFYRFVGEPARSLESISQAMRLNPRPPGWYYWTQGVSQIAAGQLENAVLTLRREETYQTGSRYQLAVALAHLGRIAEAQAEAKLFLEANPYWRSNTWIENQPFKNPKDVQIYADGFRLAGLPE